MEERRLIAVMLVLDVGLVFGSLIMAIYLSSYLWSIICVIWGGNVVFDIINMKD